MARNQYLAGEEIYLQLPKDIIYMIEVLIIQSEALLRSFRHDAVEAAVQGCVSQWSLRPKDFQRTYHFD